MKRSTSRILTTHAGSLVRPPRLLDAVRAQQNRTPDQQAYDSCLKDSVAEVVRQQAQVGVDIVSDGEFGKSTSWSLYVLKRLSGFELRPVEAGANPFARGADRIRGGVLPGRPRALQFRGRSRCAKVQDRPRSVASHAGPARLLHRKAAPRAAPGQRADR